MSQENVEVVKSAFDAFERGDMDGVLAVCDEEIVIVQAAELPGGPPRQEGHEGVLEAFAIWPGYWDDFWIQIVRTRDLGDQVLVTTDQGGRSKETGIDVTAQFTFLFTLRDAKVTEWRIFVRESEALEAAQAPG